MWTFFDVEIIFIKTVELLCWYLCKSDFFFFCCLRQLCKHMLGHSLTLEITLICFQFLVICGQCWLEWTITSLWNMTIKSRLLSPITWQQKMYLFSMLYLQIICCCCVPPSLELGFLYSRGSSLNDVSPGGAAEPESLKCNMVLETIHRESDLIL